MNDCIDEQLGLEETDTPNTLKLGRFTHKYHAFITEVRQVPSNNKTLYFARLGLISGKEDNGQGGQKNFIQNVECLLSSRLEKWAVLNISLGGLPNGYNKLVHLVEISNLQFIPVVVEGKPYLNSRGFLEAIQIGATN